MEKSCEVGSGPPTRITLLHVRVYGRGMEGRGHLATILLSTGRENMRVCRSGMLERGK